RIPGVFERGATPPGGMQRRPNAAGPSPRAVGVITRDAWHTRRAHARLVFAGLRADAGPVALVHERRDLDDEPGLEGPRLHLRTGGRALDAGRRFPDDEIHCRGQL